MDVRNQGPRSARKSHEYKLNAHHGHLSTNSYSSPPLTSKLISELLATGFHDHLLSSVTLGLLFRYFQSGTSTQVSKAICTVQYTANSARISRPEEVRNFGDGPCDHRRKKPNNNQCAGREISQQSRSFRQRSRAFRALLIRSTSITIQPAPLPKR